jgi:leader peptidase (prepilin peptidase)/N-methyltransferase
LPPLSFVLIVFAVGLLFGSFLNVCISRLPVHRSIVKPRSHCNACGHPIRWFDNLPVLSWIVLRGRCRDCDAPISWSYPLVELAMGFWLAAFSGRIYALLVFDQTTANIAPPSAIYSGGAALLAFAILGFLLIGLMVMDWQTQRLPDAFIRSGIAIGFLLVCVQAFFLAPGQGNIVLDTAHRLRMSSSGSFAAQGNVVLPGTEALIMGRIASIAGAALVLLSVRWGYKALRKRDGMGLGDVKLLAMIAAFLGFEESLLALFAGAIVASLYGVALIARGKAGVATKLPFGSFLAAGALFAALLGPRVVAWYSGLLR